MQTNKIKIFNGKIITPHRILPKGTVLIQDGKVLAVSEENLDLPGAFEINAHGKYISPGFIDIHVHGGGGYDFMDNTVTAFNEIAKTHARYGTTAMTPTTLSCEKEDLLKTLEIYQETVRQNQHGVDFLGMHIEGPYFSMNQKGAQDPKFIRNPDEKEYKEILAYSSIIKRWSAAPELKGAIAFGEYLRSKGVLAAIAHTDAIYEEVLEAYEKGFTHATHFYSCMSGVSRRNAFRYAGVIESAYLIDGMSVEIIADGIHLPPPLLKLVYKIKGPEKTALVTDSMRAAGMPPGESILGSKHNGLSVIVEDNVAKLPDRSAFAGSVATADRLVRNMITLADVPLAEAVKMMSYTPASIMKVEERKGSLIKGKDADVIIFDENIKVDTTISGGRIIYSSEANIAGTLTI